jgi:hypothetical protein
VKIAVSRISVGNLNILRITLPVVYHFLKKAVGSGQ